VDNLFPHFTLEPFTDAWLRQALAGAMQWFFAFTLVVALSFLVAPGLLAVDATATFRRLDHNHDARLTVEEMPPSMSDEFAQLLLRAGKRPGDSLTAREFRPSLPLPRSVLDYAWVSLVEFGMGLALGLGVLTIAAGLQLAGHLIDQQLGVSLGEVFNPQLDASVSLSGETLYWLGTILFLAVGGHVLVVTSLIDTFEAVPVGYGYVSQSSVELLSNLVHQSLSLAVRVSAPVMVTMAMVGIAMGYLGHTIPQINILVVGFPIRILAGLAIFGIALANMGDLIAVQFPATISELSRSLMGSSSSP